MSLFVAEKIYIIFVSVFIWVFSWGLILLTMVSIGVSVCILVVSCCFCWEVEGERSVGWVVGKIK